MGSPGRQNAVADRVRRRRRRELVRLPSQCRWLACGSPRRWSGVRPVARWQVGPDDATRATGVARASPHGSRDTARNRERDHRRLRHRVVRNRRERNRVRGRRTTCAVALVSAVGAERRARPITGAVQQFEGYDLGSNPVSPDGSMLAAAKDGAIALYPLDGGEPRTLDNVPSTMQVIHTGKPPALPGRLSKV